VPVAAQGLKGRVLRKKFVLPIKSWFFTFFIFYFFAHGFASCHLQCNCYDPNVKFLIFFKKFYKVHSDEVLNQDPCEKNNSSSFLVSNMELRLQPCVLNLIWK
jgi:hypothetical protein